MRWNTTRQLLLPTHRPATRSTSPESIVQSAANLHELLKVPPLHLEIVVEMIAALPFEAAMSYLSPIAAGLYHAHHEPRLHLRLAFQVFGQGPMLEEIRKFMAECPDRLIFDERYLSALQRLLVVYASPSAQPSRVLTSHQRATLLTCLLSMGDVLPEWSPPEPSASGDYDVSAWTNYAVQRGAYYNTLDMLEGIVRASTMLIDIANEPDLKKHPDYCPLETWAVEDFEGSHAPRPTCCWNGARGRDAGAGSSRHPT